MTDLPAYREPAFHGTIGAAREDITPPVGIYARNWGAAEHDTAEGIHRPLTATAISFQAESGLPLIMLSLDLGWWRTAEDEWAIRRAVMDALGIDESRVMAHLTHTHAGPAVCREDAGRPGGHLIPAYLDKVTESAVRCAVRARESAQPANLTWRFGTCDLATNRDVPDQAADRLLSGFNPAGAADNTLLVGRITADSGDALATIINYACHPTTLGPRNRLISPDYVGAMREVVESATGVSCLFLLGACGELAPMEQYSADAKLADSHGRRLGYSALAVLEGMLPAGTRVEYCGAIESGSALADWRRLPDSPPSSELKAAMNTVEIPLKEWPSVEELGEQFAGCRDRALAERLARKLRVRRMVGDGNTTTRKLWLWQLGDSVIVAHGNEAYSLMQTTLRARFPGRPIAVANLVNGACGYLPTEEMYDCDVYPVWQTPFDRGSLERVIDASIHEIQELTGWGS